MSAGQAATATRAVLLDIEGTTTPIAFVFDILFPYVRTHLREHLQRHGLSAEYSALVGRLRDEHAADSSSRDMPPPLESSPGDPPLEPIARYVEWLMDRDRKSTALKELQGLIWQEGYTRGELSADMFADVAPALERWKQRQVEIGIYSSGSVRAQQLLFRHSSAGDLTRFIGYYFDTTTGPKSEAGSYQRIAAGMATPAAAIVFVSDAVRELDPARAAGMQTRLAVRPGNPAVPPDHGHAVLRSFDELL